jgi:ABC-type antimicrobial peptide transport system permease subunit
VAIALACLGLLVAAAEGVVTRRRTLAALTAAGTPTRTLRRAVLVESLLPLFVAGPLAAVAGVLTVRGVVGTTTGDYLGGRMEPIPVPWGGTALVVVITLAVALLAVSASLAFLRASTDIVELRTG